MKKSNYYKLAEEFDRKFENYRDEDQPQLLASDLQDFVNEAKERGDDYAFQLIELTKAATMIGYKFRMNEELQERRSAVNNVGKLDDLEILQRIIEGHYQEAMRKTPQWDVDLLQLLGVLQGVESMIKYSIAYGYMSGKYDRKNNT